MIRCLLDSGQPGRSDFDLMRQGAIDLKSQIIDLLPAGMYKSNRRTLDQTVL